MAELIGDGDEGRPWWWTVLGLWSGFYRPGLEGDEHQKEPGMSLAGKKARSATTTRPIGRPAKRRAAAAWRVQGGLEEATWGR